VSTSDASFDIIQFAQDSSPSSDAMIVALLGQQKLLEQKDQALDKKSTELKNLQALINVLE
jgi:hypothetical protein